LRCSIKYGNDFLVSFLLSPTLKEFENLSVFAGNLLKTIVVCFSSRCEYTESQKKVCILYCEPFIKFFINFIKVRLVDGKKAEIICHIYMFHLTWALSPHYLVKRKYWSVRQTKPTLLAFGRTLI